MKATWYFVVVVVFVVTQASTKSAPAGDGQMTDSDARQQLSSEGISVDYPEPKTSLANVNKVTIDGIIQIKKDSGCEVVVTGGTEELPYGRLPRMSHVNGYKLDIRVNVCLNNYILRNTFYDHTRRSGAKVYMTADGYEFARYGNSWDIMFSY